MLNSLMILFRSVVFLIVWEISVVVSDSFKINVTVTLYFILLVAISFIFMIAMKNITSSKNKEENIVMLVVVVLVSALVLSPMFLFAGFYSMLYLIVLLVIPGLMFRTSTEGKKLYDEEESNDNEG